jgi:hypothetical protein
MSRAFRANAEKLEFVVKPSVTGFIADLILKFVDGARRLD